MSCVPSCTDGVARCCSVIRCLHVDVFVDDSLIMLVGCRFAAALVVVDFSDIVDLTVVPRAPRGYLWFTFMYAAMTMLLLQQAVPTTSTKSW